MESLPARLAQATHIAVAGTWQRHVPAKYIAAALDGRSATGRWGTENGFPVLYLGRPTDSVVVEAYRHLIDPVADAPPPVSPRALITCTVSVSTILDLRSAANRVLADLTINQMQSGTRDRDAYRACQNVAAVAHQLEFHGIIAPAATEMGDTLVLFTDRLPEQENPTRTDEKLWTELPADPRKPREGRRLRVVR
ncbi:RES family NAD+ phosphorylase (plasmid) [Mycolicibacterium psychrotolerans]|uniref:RES family NAD+ phosphorylase n=1 Tax=Mycolicibacterium psychrotolerans TaxID=216929 RepID=UPI003D66CE5A